MIRIAIVEDDMQAQTLLKEHLKRFQAETGISVEYSGYADAVSFLEAYRPVYDAVLFDVEMPYLLGTDAAKQLRSLDPVVSIIFITNMAQYAVRGYEVDALDYLIKPVAYPRFSALMKKLCRKIRFEEGADLSIRTPDGLVRLHERDLLYVTAEDHLLLYHTGDKVYESWDTLKSAESSLSKERFFRTGKSTLVNLMHVSVVAGDKIRIGDAEFTVSRNRKKDFFSALLRALGR